MELEELVYLQKKMHWNSYSPEEEGKRQDIDFAQTPGYVFWIGVVFLHVLFHHTSHCLISILWAN